MHSRRPKYGYRKIKDRYVVYEYEYTATTRSGTPMESYRNPEDACKRVYELNGWDYEAHLQKKRQTGQ